MRQVVHEFWSTTKIATWLDMGTQNSADALLAGMYNSSGKDYVIWPQEFSCGIRSDFGIYVIVEVQS